MYQIRFSTNRILCFRQGIELAKAVLLFVEQLLFECSIITIQELDSSTSEAINQLRSSKNQLNENAIYHLLSEKLEAIATNTEAVTRRSSVKKVFRPATLLKKRHRHFPVNFAIFLRTPFLAENLRWLLLSIKIN